MDVILLYYWLYILLDRLLGMVVGFNNKWLKLLILVFFCGPMAWGFNSHAVSVSCLFIFLSAAIVDHSNGRAGVLLKTNKMHYKKCQTFHEMSEFFNL